MRDRNIIRRGSRFATIATLAAMATAGMGASEASAAPPKGGVGGGVGQDGCCDTEWVKQLVMKSRNCDLGSRLASDPNAPIPDCGPGAPAATELAFDASASVAAGASTTVQMNVQVNNFMGRRLIVPKTIAPFFTIDDVRVGTKSIFDSAAPISAEQFSSENERGGWLNFIKATAGILIKADVTNVDTAAHVFRAVIEGAVW